LPFPFGRRLASVSQLSPEPFVLGAKLLHLSFHLLRMSAKFSKLGLHALHVRAHDSSEYSAHLLSVACDDLPDLRFHSLGAGHRSCNLSLPLGAKTLPLSPGFRALPQLSRIPAGLSFAGSSSYFGPVLGFSRFSPDFSFV
jgi:hypothetical protein